MTKKLADDEAYEFPEVSKLWKNTGFKEHKSENVIQFLPKKKLCRKELTQDEKEHNQKLSSQGGLWNTTWQMLNFPALCISHLEIEKTTLAILDGS